MLCREGVPYILLDEKRYHLVIAKWQKFQREGRSWENEDMANNTLREFKRHLKWAGIKPDATTHSENAVVRTGQTIFLQM